MPVIVIGADTTSGDAIIRRLLQGDREVRAFVSDEDRAEELKALGAKVALGDVSDESHVAAACTRCFTAVLVAEAATDRRERSFASTETEVLAMWADALEEAQVRRAIWVTREEYPPTAVAEAVGVDPGSNDLADRVVSLDEAAQIR